MLTMHFCVFPLKSIIKIQANKIGVQLTRAYSQVYILYAIFVPTSYNCVDISKISANTESKFGKADNRHPQSITDINRPLQTNYILINKQIPGLCAASAKVSLGSWGVISGWLTALFAKCWGWNHRSRKLFYGRAAFYHIVTSSWLHLDSDIIFRKRNPYIYGI